MIFVQQTQSSVTRALLLVFYEYKARASERVLVRLVGAAHHEHNGESRTSHRTSGLRGNDRAHRYVHKAFPAQVQGAGAHVAKDAATSMDAFARLTFV